MTVFQAIVYGVVQGISEFLPISSTAHLVLVPWLFGWEDPGLAFDVALHLGTAAAVILFFIKDWVRLIKAGLSRPKSAEGRLFWLIVAATIPGALFGVFLSRYMEHFRNAALIGAMLIVMGLVLYYADRTGRGDVEKLEATGLRRSLTIGLAQVLAVVPGVSRSGITITTGRFLGMTRETIAKFTFLMSAPIILGDALYHAVDILHTPIDTASFIVAVATSAVVGALSIKFLLGYLRKNSLRLFTIYRIVAGAAVILLYFAR